MFRKSIITPPNYGRANTVNSVQEEVNWTVSRANAAYSEAINVDGIPVLFWKKTDEGNYCTCRYGKNLEHKAIGSDNTDTAVINNPDPNSGGGTGPVTEPTDPDESIYQVRNQWDDETTDPSIPVGADRFNPATGETTPEPAPNPPAPTNQFEEQETEDEDAFLAAPIDSDIMSGMEKSQCGICLGTGKTNSWNLFGGKREIFDSYNVRNLHGFSVVDDARPVGFSSSFSLSNYAEWHYTLPTYFNKVLNFAVRNNTKSVRYLKIFYKIDGTDLEFQRLTEEFLDSRKGIPTKLILRVQPIKEAIDGELTFTHMEINWELNKPLKIQMTPLSVASNSQIAAVVTTSSFTFPPSFNNIDKDDVFLDTKYGYMWKVTDYTDFETASRQVLGWTVSARNLQSFEQQSLLKVAYDKYYETSYAGLETFQGSLLSGSDLL